MALEEEATRAEALAGLALQGLGDAVQQGAL
jgi:hypothetical protein